MAYQAASLRDTLKIGPWCLKRTLDLKMISVMALNSTRPRCGTSLTLYLGVVVMRKCSSRAQSLPVGTGASAPKHSTSSESLYILLTYVSLRGGCSSSSSSSLLTLLWSSYCYGCSSVVAPWATGLSGTTNSITKDSSSCDTCGGVSSCGSCGCGMFQGAS
jgi:hypothetical protein